VASQPVGSRGLLEKGKKKREWTRKQEFRMRPKKGKKKETYSKCKGASGGFFQRNSVG